MNPISINGTALSPQPSHVNENPVQIQTENQAIDGSLQRNWINKKNQIVLGWDYITPALYQTLTALCEGASTVVYLNTASNRSGASLTFTGLASYKQDDYMPGASAIVPFVLTIRQV